MSFFTKRDVHIMLLLAGLSALTVIGVGLLFALTGGPT